MNLIKNFRQTWSKLSTHLFNHNGESDNRNFNALSQGGFELSVGRKKDRERGDFAA